MIARLRSLAHKIEPVPETLLIFGSFARGEADADSDLDVLAVHTPAANPDKWAASLSGFAEEAQAFAGSPVQLLDYDLDELRRKAGSRAKEGRESGTKFATMPSCSSARRWTTSSAASDDSTP